VLAATNRMRQLIDDLLSYATARDAPVRFADIDLTALARDVVADRLAAGTVDDTTTAPQVHVDELPRVIGDAAMIHRLLDNLLGNALKYTPPGQVARIDITGHTASQHQVRVTIADRGVGVPTGQHQAIFQGFHRAHADADYAGTGLGLAICQRIVDRHGGAISASDNPGGGTRIQFTLPAASPLPLKQAGQR
jgi:signal transduction histidine kinase